MIAQPDGWLEQVTDLARAHGALLIADEVMTGFGRTGVSKPENRKSKSLFACQQENVQPDFMALAKGLTGGYLPMAATLTTEKVLRRSWESITSSKRSSTDTVLRAINLGRVPDLRALSFLKTPLQRESRASLQTVLRDELKSLWSLPNVGDVRQVGLVA